MGPCIKLQPCACCCPGMSRYDQIQIAIHTSLGWSLGPVTLTQTVLVADPPSSATGYRCCHCHCQYCFSPTGYYCSGGGQPVGTPDPVDPCSGHPGDGSTVRLGSVDFNCTPSAPAGGCNPPPAGNGIEDVNNNGRTRCSFNILASFQNYTCDAGYLWPNCGLPGEPGSGPILGTLDCTSATCRCPHGLYLKFGPPLYCVNGIVPPFPVTDADGYIEITGVEPGGACPDDFPCPPGIYG